MVELSKHQHSSWHGKVTGLAESTRRGTASDYSQPRSHRYCHFGQPPPFSIHIVSSQMVCRTVPEDCGKTPRIFKKGDFDFLIAPESAWAVCACGAHFRRPSEDRRRLRPPSALISYSGLCTCFCFATQPWTAGSRSVQAHKILGQFDSLLIK